MLDTFDLPTMEPNCSARNSSTVTPQSLLMMNSDFAIETSRSWARRLVSEAPELPGQIQRAWALAFGRTATEGEIAAAARFVADQLSLFTEVAAREPDASKRLDPAHWALASLCQAVLGSNEFLYVE